MKAKLWARLCSRMRPKTCRTRSGPNSHCLSNVYRATENHHCSILPDPSRPNIAICVWHCLTYPKNRGGSYHWLSPTIFQKPGQPRSGCSRKSERHLERCTLAKPSCRKLKDMAVIIKLYAITMPSFLLCVRSQNMSEQIPPSVQK